MRELLKAIQEQNILLEVVDGQLRVFTDGSPVEQQLVDQIRARKTELVQWLQHRSQDNTSLIPAAEKADSYVLSSAQYRLWIMSRLGGGGLAYHIPGTLLFEQPLDIKVLQQAFAGVLQRYEIVRTVFKEQPDGTVRQYITSPAQMRVEVAVVDLEITVADEAAIEEALKQFFLVPFDLATGPLWRAGVYRLRDGKQLLAFVMHHIISDGWSMAILINEWMAYYKSGVEQSTGSRPPLPFQYKDYAVWQQQQLTGEAMQQHRQYWLQQLGGELPVLQLPLRQARPAIRSYRGSHHTFTIDRQDVQHLKRLLQEQGATLFMGLVTLLNMVLYKYTGQREILLGTPVSGRQQFELEKQVGLFANTVVLRSLLEATDSFTSLCHQVKQLVLQGFHHQAYPFDLLVSDLGVKPDLSRNPLFDVMVVLQEQTADTHWQDLGAVEYKKVNDLGSKFDLLFDCRVWNDDLQIVVEYNTDIYELAMVEAMAGHFVALLRQVLVAPAAPVDGLDIMSDKEKRQVLYDFNDTINTHYNIDRTLTELFEEQADLLGEATALVFKEKTWSYRQLQVAANQLAHYLREKYGIVPDDLVGIRLERSEWMVIALLATMKSGGAYVPIDPAYPQDRVDYIVADSACKVLIDEEELAKFKAVAHRYSEANPVRVNKPTDLLYVLYTSGSTGRPKGCMLEHRGLVNRIGWMWETYGFSRQDVVLQKTTYTFDVSMWELLMPLCWGCRMVLCERADIAAPARLVALIEQQGVTCLHFVPSMLKAFIGTVFDEADLPARLRSVRCVVTSGEALDAGTVNAWYNRLNIPVYNFYGPTEASIEVTYYNTRKGDGRIPIGRPIWNTQIYILDDENRVVPVGVTGELCIGGVGVARGYLNQAALTDTKFVANPFRRAERMYRTGDLARWLPGGEVEYLGRRDDQLKIRGYRIEPGEIAGVLQTQAGVTAAVVTGVATAGGEQELVAYVVGDVQPAWLREALLQQLPAYMVPAHFVSLTELPLGSSGKVDRSRLPAPDRTAQSTTAYVAPRNHLEELLQNIWQEVLQRDRIGIRDNFFELGGHSLRATRLLSIINKTVGLELELKDVFMSPTIEGISHLIKADQWAREAKNINAEDRNIIEV